MGETPRALQERPQLFEDLEPVVQAFSVLSASRPYHVGMTSVTPGAISFSEIKSYCELMRVEDLDEFVRLVRVLDDAYLRCSAEKRRQKES